MKRQKKARARISQQQARKRRAAAKKPRPGQRRKALPGRGRKAKPAPKPRAKPAPKPRAKPAPKPRAKPAPKPRAKSAPKPRAKPAPKPRAKPAPKPKARVKRARDLYTGKFVKGGPPSERSIELAERLLDMKAELRRVEKEAVAVKEELRKSRETLDTVLDSLYQEFGGMAPPASRILAIAKRFGQPEQTVWHQYFSPTFGKRK